MQIYCKTAHPTDNTPRSLNPSQGYTKPCIEFGMSASPTGWLADGGYLWDRAAVRGIEKKESKGFEFAHWFQVLKVRSQCGREGWNVLLFVTCST